MPILFTLGFITGDNISSNYNEISEYFTFRKIRTIPGNLVGAPGVWQQAIPVLEQLIFHDIGNLSKCIEFKGKSDQNFNNFLILLIWSLYIHEIVQHLIIIDVDHNLITSGNILTSLS